MAVEGTLHVALAVEDGAVARVDVRSTRPDVARTLLAGRTRAEVAAAVPRLFAVCARSQAAAGALACAAAAGELDDAALAHARDTVAAEMLREAAWRTLLDWPRALGEAPAGDAVAAARAALAPPDGAARAAIAHAVFGTDAQRFAALDGLHAFDRWCAAGATAAARFVRDLPRHEPMPDGAGDALPWIAGPDAPPRAAALAAALDADPAFVQRPHWHGAPAETGALSRWRDDPLVRAVLEHDGHRLRARFVARLRELARLLAGDVAPAVGVLALGAGDALAWVDNARGLLLHRVRLERAGDVARVARYAIVAPTEWNFHPEGALARALEGSPAADPDLLQRRATRLVQSLDPCVTCEVTVVDA